MGGLKKKALFKTPRKRKANQKKIARGKGENGEEAPGFGNLGPNPRKGRNQKREKKFLKRKNKKNGGVFNPHTPEKGRS